MRSRGFSPIFLVIAVAIVITVAFVFYKLGPIQSVDFSSEPAGQVEGDKIKRDLTVISQSDDINVIEKELNATNIDKLDEGLDLSLKQAGF